MTIIDPSVFQDAKIPTHKRFAMDAVVATVMTFSIEVISLPVNDVDRALRFYVDRVGFRIDVDYAPNGTFRLVQLTPPGSSCSIQFGTGLGDALTGAFRSSSLFVSDLEAARNRLLENGVEVSAIRHKTPMDAWIGCYAAGLDPARRDDASFADFFDPDGNRWILQERSTVALRRIDSRRSRAP
jgi:catechol 2,3-dioxygenase-like lactoylglutathione lyase family enzyme